MPKIKAVSKINTKAVASSAVLFFVVIVKDVSAFRAELRRIRRVLRLPTALVTTVKRFSLRLLGTAALAELTLIYCTA